MISSLEPVIPRKSKPKIMSGTANFKNRPVATMLLGDDHLTRLKPRAFEHRRFGIGGAAHDVRAVHDGARPIDRDDLARVCGRLGLYRARLAHSPSRRASFESREAQSIGRSRGVSTDGATWVTFADEAIRGSFLHADSQS